MPQCIHAAGNYSGFRDSVDLVFRRASPTIAFATQQITSVTTTMSIKPYTQELGENTVGISIFFSISTGGARHCATSAKAPSLNATLYTALKGRSSTVKRYCYLYLRINNQIQRLPPGKGRRQAVLRQQRKTAQGVAGNCDVRVNGWRRTGCTSRSSRSNTAYCCCRRDYHTHHLV